MKVTRFAAFAWAVLAYNLFVVLWGAFVRATGSGAGCGSHWPLCNGVVMPRPERIETIIELGHRLTSGLALLAVVALLIGAFRRFPPRHRVRRAAAVSTAFIIVEALLGAGLVLLELVAENDSIARAYWMIGHLLNTFLLIAALTLTAWWASGGAPVRVRGSGLAGGLLALSLGGVLLVGATGAIAALGATLFPVQGVADGIRADLAPGAHILVRLRLIHPVVSVAVGAFLLIAARLCRRANPSRDTARMAGALSALVVTQLVLGAANIALHAPVWMQLVHLLLADLLWIALLLLAATVLSVGSPAGAPARAERAAGPRFAWRG